MSTITADVADTAVGKMSLDNTSHLGRPRPDASDALDLVSRRRMSATT
jgi:hypothetical protein